MSEINTVPDVDKDFNDDSSNSNLDKNISLSFDIDDEIKKLSCQSKDLEEEQNVYSKLEEFENKNRTINNKCNKYENFINSSGSSGTIYESEDDKKYIKFSTLPTETTKLFNKGDIDCDLLRMKIDKSINENKNSLKYEELKEIFPLNIMKIYSTSECKNADGNFSNIIEMEKISGQTLNQFLTNLDLKKPVDNYRLICCIIQLIYITLYSNFNGFVHNDLTTNNIMVYDVETNFDFTKLKINKNKIEIEFKNNFNGKIPVIKLIDFSYSTYISTDKLGDKIIFGETKQIIKIIKNKLSSINKSSSFINNLDELINHYLKKLGFDSFFALDNNYRLMSDEDIILNVLNANDVKKFMLDFIENIFNIVNQLYPNNFIFNIINLTHKNKYFTNKEVMNINSNIDENNIDVIKKKLKSSTSSKYYLKYIKYKNKYLTLKNNKL